MTLVCTLGFFTACSSSDDDDKSSVWDTFKGGSYAGLWAEELETKDSLDYTFSNFTMTVGKAGDNTAQIAFTEESTNLIVTVPEATITTTSNGYTLAGSGTAEANGITKSTSVTVNISSDNKTASAEFKYADGKTLTVSNSKALPTCTRALHLWYAKPVMYLDKNDNEVEPTDPNATYVEASFNFTWGAQDSIIYNNQKMAADQLSALVASSVNTAFGNSLISVALTSEGKIYAEYYGEDGKRHIAEDYATFESVDKETIKLKFNKEKILANEKDANEKAALEAVLSLYDEGITMRLVSTIISKDLNGVYFCAGQEVAEKLIKSEAMKNIVANLKDEDLDGMGAFIKCVAGQAQTLLNSTIAFEIGLEFIE